MKRPNAGSRYIPSFTYTPQDQIKAWGTGPGPLNLRGLESADKVLKTAIEFYELHSFTLYHGKV